MSMIRFSQNCFRQCHQKLFQMILFNGSMSSKKMLQSHRQRYKTCCFTHISMFIATNAKTQSNWSGLLVSGCMFTCHVIISCICFVNTHKFCFKHVVQSNRMYQHQTNKACCIYMFTLWCSSGSNDKIHFFKIIITNHRNAMKTKKQGFQTSKKISFLSYF